jgi:hypothetical protein
VILFRTGERRFEALELATRIYKDDSVLLISGSPIVQLKLNNLFFGEDQLVKSQKLNDWNVWTFQDYEEHRKNNNNNNSNNNNNKNNRDVPPNTLVISFGVSTNDGIEAKNLIYMIEAFSIAQLLNGNKVFFHSSNIILRAVSHLTVLFEVPYGKSQQDEEDLKRVVEDWKKFAKVKVLE